MNKKFGIGIVIVVTIVALTMMFAGCVEKEAPMPTPTPSPTPILTPTSTPAPAPTAVPAVSAKGPASNAILFKEVPVESAGHAVQTGQIDYYIFGLTPTQAEDLEGAPDITLYSAPASFYDIVTNPAPAPENQLNPLSIREIRFALNYLMDRDYSVEHVYKGFAAPMVTFLSEYDPDFITIQDIVAKYNFTYDPATAEAIINEAMTQAGATKVEGKWYYNDKPVTLTFIIRVEDERREIGDALASALESVGFTVEREYMTYEQAQIVYQTNPANLDWHLYTESWVKEDTQKYDSSEINSYGAPWYGEMPGYQEAGWWQYENATIDELGKKIYYGDFTSKEERDELYKECTELIIQESVRIWIATKLDAFPARSEVKGITEDAALGLRSLYNLREVFVPGQKTITIGNLYIHTEESAWNPVGGHVDSYSSDIWKAVHDPCMWNHPFSGLPQPFRWSYTVETEGPSVTMTVPPDAFVWNAASNRWETVGPDVTAKSKVTFDLSRYIGTKWHHNQTITWADVLYTLSQTWEIAYDMDKSAIESGISATQSESLKPFKGFRIVGNDLEVYVDYWHFSDDYIADFACLGGHYPWEVLAAMDNVVFEDKALMYSERASESLGVPWMSVNLKDHASLVNGALDDLDYSDLANIFTVSGTVYATESDLAERVDAAQDWFNEHRNLVISDGPFYLNEFNASEGYANLSAFRDSDYPFSKGDWYYGATR